MPVAPSPQPERPIGEPYCGNCGYALKDLTDVSRCPECGKPLVDVLLRRTPGGFGPRAIRIKSEVTVFGWPLYHIALGPRPEFGEAKGVARGVIAIGDVAVGGVAIGGMAFGGIAMGGCAIGLGSLGGAAIGLLAAAGGGAFGTVAVGGGAVGGFATGGGALGFAAQGGAAVGVYARGGGAFGLHTIDGRGNKDPAAVEMFSKLSPIMGSTTPAGIPHFGMVLLPVVFVDLLILLAVGVLVIVGRRSHAANPYAPAISNRGDERRTPGGGA